MNKEHTRRVTYLSYLLRLWQAGSRGDRSVWHASLENPHTGERLAFGDMEALFAFLVERTNPPICAGNLPETSERTGTEEERTLP